MLPLYSRTLTLIILLHHNFVISRMLYEWKHSLPDLITDLQMSWTHGCLLLPWKDSRGARSVFCDPACWRGEATGGASGQRSGALSSVRRHTHCAKGLGEFLIAEKRFCFFFFFLLVQSIKRKFRKRKEQICNYMTIENSLCNLHQLELVFKRILIHSKISRLAFPYLLEVSKFIWQLLPFCWKYS